MIHKIKLRESFADAVICREKNFEVRLNDRGYQKGDYIVFKVVTDDGLTPVDNVLNEWFFEITYVLSGWGIKEDYCVFGFKRATYEDELRRLMKMEEKKLKGEMEKKILELIERGDENGSSNNDE